jgi:hypothetical protein
MVKGLTMIKTVPGQEKLVYQELLDRSGIESIHHAFGGCDFMVVIQADGISSLEMIVDEITGLSQVACARTIVVNGQALC